MAVFGGKVIPSKINYSKPNLQLSEEITYSPTETIAAKIAALEG